MAKQVTAWKDKTGRIYHNRDDAEWADKWDVLRSTFPRHHYNSPMSYMMSLEEVGYWLKENQKVILEVLNAATD